MEDEGLGATHVSDSACPMNLDEAKKHDIDNPEGELVKEQDIVEKNNAIEMEKGNTEKLTFQQVVEGEPDKSVGGSLEEAVSLENSNISNSNIDNTLKSEMHGENKESMKIKDSLCKESGNKDKHLSKIDFSVFEEGLYRRYKSFFHDEQVNEIDLSQDKVTVSKKINEHFSGFEINPVDVIRTFLVLRKNSEHSHGHFVMSPAQSPEPNIHPSSEGNTRGRRCANKDIGSVGNDANNTEANASGTNSYKGEYKSENSSIADNHTEIGVSTRNSRKGRVSNRGRR